MATSTSRSSGTSKRSGASTTKKTSTTKSVPRKRATASGDGNEKAGAEQKGSGPEKRSGARAQARPPARATQVAARAASELLELTGKASEGVTGLERTDEGWTVQVEVVEVRRIPDTTDVLALYEVTTDSHGSLLGYRRTRRYTRGSAGERE